jgi:hypothetical protein
MGSRNGTTMWRRGKAAGQDKQQQQGGVSTGAGGRSHLLDPRGVCF